MYSIYIEHLDQKIYPCSIKKIRNITRQYPGMRLKSDKDYLRTHQDLEKWIKVQDTTHFTIRYWQTLPELYLHKIKKYIYSQKYDMDAVKQINISLDAVKKFETNGSCKFFPQKIMQDEIFCKIIVHDDNWDGNIHKFDIKFRNCEYFCDLVINSPKWNGSCKYFGKSLMDNIFFCKKVTESPLWDGNCTSFTKIAMSYRMLRDLIVKSPFWDGRRSNFPRDHVFKGVDLCRKIMYSRNWDGSCKGFDHSLMNNITFCYEIVRNPKWNKDRRYFTRRVTEDDTFRRIAK